MTLAIPAPLYTDVMRLVNENGYSVEDAIAKAAANASRTRQDRRSASEGVIHEETPAAAPREHTGANTRREPVRDALPEAGTIAPLNEKQFQGMVEYVFRQEGWMVYHTYNSRRSEPGFPDICAVHPVRGIVFAELKMPKGKVSEAQQRWIDALRAAGGNAYVWRPDDWGKIIAVASGREV